ncbi:capsular biosynthesis protein [Fructobacillus sp. M2-14]|uniref:Capsular polysaccharide biosynthesis protein CpsC n=1 Tax=Fructobacillus broussonetiae TaxID=2713173 RepID=A0ABS5R0A0_9LACO|nr:Wzz/FepE/Etk N-terminal domain-containing protein [Fructobacillus broussonetiae]MBS9338873.1 capsular biosynthesis protein [Fructobacillus broussonetiae]
MEFTLRDLLKRFVRYSWLIVLAVIAFSAIGYLYSKSAKVTTNYSASRSVIVAKNNTDVKDPNSRVQADRSLIATYEKIAQDDSIISEVKNSLPFKMKKADIASAVTVDNPTDTLMLAFKSGGETPEKAKTLANTYAEVFAKKAVQIYPDMGDVRLLSEANGSDVIQSGMKSTKKLTIFGAVFGLALSAFLILLVGAITNYYQFKRAI